MTDYYTEPFENISAVTGAPTGAYPYRRVREMSRSAVVKTAAHALRRSNPSVYLPPTYFYGSRREWYHTVQAYRQPGGNGNTGYSLVLPYSYADTLDSATQQALESRALMQALGNLKGQSVNYAQAFAERRQTARLVGESATQIGKAILSLREGEFTRAARQLGLGKGFLKPKKGSKASIGDRWLELQYGWKPLLSDVYGAVSDLAKRDKDDPRRYGIRVNGAAVEKVNFLKNNANGVQVGERSLVKCVKSVRVKLDYYLSSPALAQAAGTGILNPAVLAWELLPWSFVADWFVPVGSYLNCLDASAGFSFKGGYNGYHQTSTNLVFDLGPGGYGYSGSQAEGARYCVSAGFTSHKFYERRPYTTNPHPRFPGFKNPLSLTHMANALSLLAGATKVR